METKTTPAGAFEQGCLALLDEVAVGGRSVIITTHGRPLARLIPIASDAEREAEQLAALRGSVSIACDEATLLEPLPELASEAELPA